VVKAVTPTTVTASKNPVSAGERLTLTATVISPGGGTPTGTVRSFMKSRPPSKPVPLVGGTASIDIIAPEASDRGNFVSASYSGDGNYEQSYGGLTLEVY